MATAITTQRATGAPGRLERPARQRRYRDGDLVEIEAGWYVGDVTIWRQNNLILRGINGHAHLQAAGMAAGDKAIGVIKGFCLPRELGKESASSRP